MTVKVLRQREASFEALLPSWLRLRESSFVGPNSKQHKFPAPCSHLNAWCHYRGSQFVGSPPHNQSPDTLIIDKLCLPPTHFPLLLPSLSTSSISPPVSPQHRDTNPLPALWLSLVYVFPAHSQPKSLTQLRNPFTYCWVIFQSKRSGWDTLLSKVSYWYGYTFTRPNNLL